MKNSVTHEEFLQKIEQEKEHNPSLNHVEVVSEYKNSLETIKVRCTLHDREWEVRPRLLLTRGTRCPECSSSRYKPYRADFTSRVKRANPNIKLLQNYTKGMRKIRVKCEKDGFEWSIRPLNLCEPVECPQCTVDTIKLPNTNIIETIKKVNNHVTVLDTVVTQVNEIKVKCNKCDREYSETLLNLLSGRHCLACGRLDSNNHEQFLEKLKFCNPNITPLEEYKASSCKMSVKCDVCNHVWKALPLNLFKSSQCPKCSRKKRTKTQEQFLLDLKERCEHAEPLTSYVNSHTPIDVVCYKGVRMHNTYQSLFKNKTCAACEHNRRFQKIEESAKAGRGYNRKTHKQYVKEVEKVNPHIEVIGTYVNAVTHIKYRCKVDGYEWEALPNNILRGAKCPRCSSSVSMSHEEFVERVKQINPHIEVVGKFTNLRSRIAVKCKHDGNVWSITCNYLIHNQVKCSVCRSRGRYKTHSQFTKQLAGINPHIELISYYYNDEKQVKCRCKLDETVWYTYPQDLLKGEKCPSCDSKIRR